MNRYARTKRYNVFYSFIQDFRNYEKKILFIIHNKHLINTGIEYLLLKMSVLNMSYYLIVGAVSRNNDYRFRQVQYSAGAKIQIAN